jgi:hypothetical protein
MLQTHSSLEKTVKLVKQATESFAADHPYRPYMEIIVQKCEPFGIGRLRVGEGNPKVDTYEDLVDLHAKVDDPSLPLSLSSPSLPLSLSPSPFPSLSLSLSLSLSHRSF